MLVLVNLLFNNYRAKMSDYLEEFILTYERKTEITENQP